MITHLFLDFDGVLTDNNVYTSYTGEEFVRCSKYDSMGINLIKELGVNPVIVSSDISFVVAQRASKMDIDCFYGIE
ncbi:MAG: 3-deoxy-D-manno-octulosonate 8-phosphate phosphatase, partial [Candidatus Omnitrophica bacterium]|nr:3-deoxy-D-manno-octulosonate 8-phosphate phosphatase [Candidatus Omnitrophota bacterium]